MVTIGFTGHRGLGPVITEQVSALLRAELAAVSPGELVGVTLGADGADTLFAHAVLAVGGAIEVVVPATKYRDGLPDEHHSEYDRLIRRARRVHTLDYVESNPESHMAASVVLLSLADELVAVWDGQPSRGYGGTADVVDEARKLGLPVRVVWPLGAIRP